MSEQHDRERGREREQRGAREGGREGVTPWLLCHGWVCVRNNGDEDGSWADRALFLAVCWGDEFRYHLPPSC